MDMCEIARNSVLQSGFETAIKCKWLGQTCQTEGPEGNRVEKSNVPNIRAKFRYSMLVAERQFLRTGFTIDDCINCTSDTVTAGAALKSSLHADIEL